jgi:hypothetical protein
MNPDLSQQNISGIKGNIPSTQALLVDGRQFKTHTAWLFTLKLDIFQNPGQTASLSLMLLQDCQQNNYITVNIN